MLHLFSLSPFGLYAFHYPVAIFIYKGPDSCHAHRPLSPATNQLIPNYMSTCTPTSRLHGQAVQLTDCMQPDQFSWLQLDLSSQPVWLHPARVSPLPTAIPPGIKPCAVSHGTAPSRRHRQPGISPYPHASAETSPD